MNYFTSIEFVNGLYVGVVYNAANNNIIYRTPPHHEQLQALKEANQFLTTQSAPVSNPRSNHSSTPSLPLVRKKCCGQS